MGEGDDSRGEMTIEVPHSEVPLSLEGRSEESGFCAWESSADGLIGLISIDPGHVP